MKAEFKELAPLAAAIALAGSSLPASAFEWRGTLGLGAWHSDNERRLTSAELDEVTLEPSASLSLLHETKALRLNANYVAQRRDFQDDIQTDQTVLTGNGLLLWEALPNRLDFVVRQNNTESTGRAFALGTQDNRQEVRTLEASPRLRFRLRRNDELQFEYRYRETEAELTNIQSEGQDLIARYSLGLNETSRLALEFVEGETEYELQVVPDLDQRRLQAIYSRTNERANFLLSVGQTELTREGRSNIDGFVCNMLWSVPFGERGSFNLFGSRNITDNSDQFLNRGNSLGPIVPGFQFGNTDLVEVSTNDTVRADFNMPVGANRLSLFAGRTKQNFEDVPRDQEQVNAGFRLRRDLTRRLNGALGYNLLDVEQEQLGAANFKQWFVNAGLYWTPARNVEVSLLSNYSERDGEPLAGGEFTELRFFIGLSYAFGPGQRNQTPLMNR